MTKLFLLKSYNNDQEYDPDEDMLELFSMNDPFARNDL